MQSMVLIEVQDTLAQQPSEVDSMKKATGFSIAITVSASVLQASSSFGGC